LRHLFDIQTLAAAWDFEKRGHFTDGNSLIASPRALKEGDRRLFTILSRSGLWDGFKFVAWNDTCSYRNSQTGGRMVPPFVERLASKKEGQSPMSLSSISCDFCGFSFQGSLE